MQPETRFKRKFDQAFGRLFGGEKSPDSYRVSIEKGRGQKDGLPDRFYTARGGHCWVESKCHPNTLSPIQLKTIRRMACGGSRVLVAVELPGKTEFQLIEYGSDGEPCEAVTYPIEEIKSEAFWLGLLKGYSQCCLQ